MTYNLHIKRFSRSFSCSLNEVSMRWPGHSHCSARSLKATAVKCVSGFSKWAALVLRVELSGYAKIRSGKKQLNFGIFYAFYILSLIMI